MTAETTHEDYVSRKVRERIDKALSAIDDLDDDQIMDGCAYEENGAAIGHLVAAANRLTELADIMQAIQDGR
jgi:hypothetical protein